MYTDTHDGSLRSVCPTMNGCSGVETQSMESNLAMRHVPIRTARRPRGKRLGVDVPTARIQAAVADAMAVGGVGLRDGLPR
jgi:hypothetical protein